MTVNEAIHRLSSFRCFISAERSPDLFPALTMAIHVMESLPPTEVKALDLLYSTVLTPTEGLRNAHVS